MTSALDLLGELVAIVRGECPSLLSEDSGGSAELSLRIDAALSRAPGDLELGSSTRMTSPASRSPKQHSDGRSPADYAIEHGGYLADAVTAFLKVVGEECVFAEMSDNGLRETVSDHLQAMRSGVYEFEKRVTRAKALSGAQRSELTRLAQDEPVSSPPSTGGEGEDWDRIPRAKRFGRRLNESAVKHLAPGTLLRFYSEDPWFDPSPSSPANGDIVVFTGEVSNTFPKVGPHLEVRTLGGRVYPGGGWVYQIFQFVADPSPEMGENGLSREELGGDQPAPVVRGQGPNPVLTDGPLSDGGRV